MKKLPYKEGDIFAVSLRGGGFALGVVARAPKQGRVLFGYFFPKFYESVPIKSELPEFRPQDAIKIVRFGDLSLMNGDWPIISAVANWEREKWPVTKFIRQDPLSKKAWLVSYADTDPSVEIGEESCEPGIFGYERASILGAGAVELLLTKIFRAA